MINEDISKLDIDDVFNEYKNIDVIVGGPPCQGFSQKGKRKIMDDPRNYLFKYFFEVVSVVRPKYFVLENVPNILTANNGHFKDEIYSLCSSNGYTLGGDVVKRAVKNIFKGQVFDESFLMSIATIGAFFIGEYPEGVAVMLFYQVGELFQSYAVGKSRKSIASLMDIRPDYANVKKGDELVKVDPDEVQIGDIIVIKAGEKIPLDGKVIEGSSMIDTSALTGESVPREVEVGSDILSGCININGVITAEVTKEFGESTVSKILD